MIIKLIDTPLHKLGISPIKKRHSHKNGIFFETNQYNIIRNYEQVSPTIYAFEDEHKCKLFYASNDDYVVLVFDNEEDFAVFRLSTNYVTEAVETHGLFCKPELNLSYELKRIFPEYELLITDWTSSSSEPIMSYYMEDELKICFSSKLNEMISEEVVDRIEILEKDLLGFFNYHWMESESNMETKFTWPSNNHDFIEYKILTFQPKRIKWKTLIK